MLTWDEDTRKGHGKKELSLSYRAQVPHWGEASVHPHIHHPGEMFLDCLALGVDMHPLGVIDALDALNPAERFLMQTLKQHAVWCIEAMAAIGSPEGSQ